MDGNNPRFGNQPGQFLEKTFEFVRAYNLPLIGKLGFFHYPSSAEAAKARERSPALESFAEEKLGEKMNVFTYSFDSKKHRTHIEVPINGPIGHRLFSFSSQNDIPFLIHYEIEDDKLAALEEMLGQYPDAKVIWCHLTRVRFKDRSSVYGPDYIERLINKYPNIHFDLFFDSPGQRYPGSDDLSSLFWKIDSQNIQQTEEADDRWKALIIKYPWRFHIGLSLGPPRMTKFFPKMRFARAVMNNFPREVQTIIGYRATWKLIFNEDPNASGLLE